MGNSDRRTTDTRQRLIDAAIDLIAARGSQEVTLAAVARACGVSPPACYKHFPSKADLMAAALRQVSTALGAQVDQRLDRREQDPVESLLTIGEVLIDLADRRTRLFDFSQLSPETVDALSDPDSFPLLVRTRHEVGRIAAARGDDPERVHLIIWSCFLGYTRLIAAGVTRPDRDFMCTTINTVITIGDHS